MNAQTLIDQGYRITSSKHGRASRIDRADWKEFMAKEGYSGCGLSDLELADQYRRVYSKDTIIVPASLIPGVPNSKDKL